MRVIFLVEIVHSLRGKDPPSSTKIVLDIYKCYYSMHSIRTLPLKNLIIDSLSLYLFVYVDIYIYIF